MSQLVRLLAPELEGPDNTDEGLPDPFLPRGPSQIHGMRPLRSQLQGAALAVVATTASNWAGKGSLEVGEYEGPELTMAEIFALANKRDIQAAEDIKDAAVIEALNMHRPVGHNARFDVVGEQELQS
jgi:hypothetical protein